MTTSSYECESDRDNLELVRELFYEELSKLLGSITYVCIERQGSEITTQVIITANGDNEYRLRQII